MDEGNRNVAAIAAMSMGMLAGCGGSDQEMRTAMQIAARAKHTKSALCSSMQHGSLDEANQGMIDGLKDNGYVGW